MAIILVQHQAKQIGQEALVRVFFGKKSTLKGGSATTLGNEIEQNQ